MVILQHLLLGLVPVHTPAHMRFGIFAGVHVLGHVAQAHSSLSAGRCLPGRLLAASLAFAGLHMQMPAYMQAS